jgi:Mrp family chromosome partitioning ATPase
MAGALSVARGERLAAGAEWSPYSQRQALVAEVHAARHVARATRRHREPTDPTTAPALGLAYPGGDLYPWLRKRGRSIEVVIPAREQRLAMAVLGIPGSGKTFTLLRRVWIAARAGMRVVFLDCKGTDPGWRGR